jgi:hypothetical protein
MNGYIADTSQGLNTLNKSIQGKNENILTLTYKTKSFKEN